MSSAAGVAVAPGPEDGAGEDGPGGQDEVGLGGLLGQELGDGGDGGAHDREDVLGLDAVHSLWMGGVGARVERGVEAAFEVPEERRDPRGVACAGGVGSAMV